MLDNHLQIGPVPVDENLYVTTMKNWGKVFHVEFILENNVKIGTGYVNIIHLTKGGDNGKLGDRIPAVWKYQTEKLYISSGINDAKDEYVMSQPLYNGQTYHVIISQKPSGSHHLYEVWVNGEKMKSTVNKKAKDFGDVEVWTSDPWYSGIDTIGNLKALVVTDVIPESGI